jgi:hypothetical protein
MAVRENRFECSGKTEMGVRANPFSVFERFRNRCSAKAEIHTLTPKMTLLLLIHLQKNLIRDIYREAQKTGLRLL